MTNEATILVVDDSAASLALLVNLLTRAGYHVRPAESGELALAAVTASAPDLILLDVRMKGLDGIEVCRRLKAREETRRIPILLISAFADVKEAVEGLQLGAADYVTKPFQPEELLARVRIHLALSRASVSLEEQTAALRQTNEQLRLEVVERQRVEGALRKELDKTERSRKAMLSTLEDQKRIEEALRESEERFVTAFQSSPTPMTITSAATARYIEVNEVFLRESGYGRDEVVGHTSEELGLFCDPGDRERLVAQVGKEGFVYGMEIRCRVKSGGVRDCLISIRRIQLDREPHLLSTIIDVTDRKQAEAERVRLTTAIEQAAEMVLVTDAEGAIVYVNPAFEAVTGYARAEVLGRNPRVLKTAMQDKAFYRTLWETISGGKTWHGRLVNQKKDGTRYTQDSTISPVRNVAGVITSYVAVNRDVTRDLVTDTQLRQAQKMESVGRLAGGVAHDFNNALGVILGHADMALKRMDPSGPDRLRRDLEVIRDAGLRSASLTRQLLAFARKQTIIPKVLDLNDAVAGMLNMLRRLIGEDIDLAWLPGASLWPVVMDPAQIDQILANLAVNARDAIGGVGKLTVETHNVTLDAAYCAGHADSVPGDYVTLVVSDDGSGMEKDVIEHLFEPFFTTKEVGQGTGLGLATVYGIVRQNSGSIDVHSEPGTGTTFRLYLPRAAGTVPDVAPGRAAKEPRGRGETVLLVEDEPAMLQMVTEALTDLGYSVLAAGQPSDALRAAQAHTAGIDLLITDVVMPEMSGRVLAEQLAAIRPGLRCLFVSGYTADVIARRGVLEDGVRFLQKPFSRGDLAVKVHEALRD